MKSLLAHSIMQRLASSGVWNLSRGREVVLSLFYRNLTFPFGENLSDKKANSSVNPTPLAHTDTPRDFPSSSSVNPTPLAHTDTPRDNHPRRDYHSLLTNWHYIFN
ncbi:hypothetical protein TNCV_1248781 [Trichonephila clavipes]|nr:hypothetical protein TNCV_1248781 [Trichonephila clavipes]